MNSLQYIKKREMGFRPIYREDKKLEKLNVNFVLKRLRANTKEMHHLRNLGLDVPPFSCQFSSVPGGEHVLAVSNEDGYIFLLNSEKAYKGRYLTHWNAHNNAIFDIRWLPGRVNMISASGDNSAVLWDVYSKKKVAVFIGHQGTVRCIDVSPTQSVVFATGSRDGTIRIWDCRCNNRGTSKFASEATIYMASDQFSKVKQKKPIPSQMRNIHRTSVTSLAFQQEHELFASGVTDGGTRYFPGKYYCSCNRKFMDEKGVSVTFQVIKVWDLRKTYSIHKKQPLPKYELPHWGPKIHGFVSMVFDSNRKYLYASCTDHTIYCYDCHSYNPQYVRSYKGFKANSYFVKLAINRDDEYLLSGSSDEMAYIWKISEPGTPIIRLPGHTDEVTSVAWNPIHSTMAVTCGDDTNVLFWEVDIELREKFTNDFSCTYAEPFSLPNVNNVGQPESTSLTPANHLSKMQEFVQNTLPHSPLAKKQKLSNSLPPITQWFSPSVPKRPDVSTSQASTLSESVSSIKNTVTNRNKSFEETINNLGYNCEVLSPNKICPDDCASSSDQTPSLGYNCEVLSPNKIRPDDCASSSDQTLRVLNIDDDVTNKAATGNNGGQDLIDKENSALILNEKEKFSVEQNVVTEKTKKIPSFQIHGGIKAESHQLSKSAVPNNRKASFKRKNEKSKEENCSARAITSYFSTMSPSNS